MEAKKVQFIKFEGGPSSDVKELINVLGNRRAKLYEWIEKAFASYNKGDYESFVELLDNALKHGSTDYADHKNDQLKTLMMLAGHFVRLACSEPRADCSLLLAKVQQLLKAADQLNIALTEIPHLLSRGFGLMLIGTKPQDLQDAEQCFNGILRQESINMRALLGLGCLAYNRQDYRLALRYFKTILMFYPKGPMDVRVGIAQCFLKLGDLVRARSFFELAYNYNSSCLNALIGLAQLKINEGNLESNKQAHKMLLLAFKLNNNHPTVLSWLSGFLFQSGDYDNSRLYAAKSIKNADSDQLKAEIFCQIARCYQAMSNYELALKFYNAAVKYGPGYAPPYMGLAQMYVRRDELHKVENSLKILLKLRPETKLALRMLATFYVQKKADDNLDIAIKMYQSALSDEDYDTWLGLAAAYQRKELWQDALNSYDQATHIYHRVHGTIPGVPLTWPNNIAALQVLADNPKAALRTLDKANSMTPNATQKHFEENLLTFRFNKARVLEKMHLIGQAEYYYKKLIFDYPNYYGSYFRLGQIAYERNQLKAAIEKYKAVIRLDANNETANIQMFNIRIRQGDLKHANVNSDVLKHRNPDDSYIRLILGSLALNKAQVAIDKGKMEGTKFDMQLVLIHFNEPIKNNNHNVWAANAIGVALFTFNQYLRAQKIFREIAESTNCCSAAIFNCAKVSLMLGNYSEAIEMCKRYLKNFPSGNCVEAMKHLAVALFKTGSIKEAKYWLQRARHVAPHDLSLLYCLSIVIKQEARNIFYKEGSKLDDLLHARAELNLAHSSFHFLGQKKEFKNSPINQANAQCSELLNNPPAELKKWLEYQKNLQNEEKNVYTNTKKERSSRRHRESSSKSHSKSKKVDLEPSIKPLNLVKEHSTRSKRTDKEKSVRPKDPTSEPSSKTIKLEKLDREPPNIASEVEQESCTKPSISNEASSSKEKEKSSRHRHRSSSSLEPKSKKKKRSK